MPKFVCGEPFAASSLKFGLPNAEKYDRTINLVGFDDYRDFPSITRGLVERGYNDEQIKGILGENFLRVFKDVCG
jgi:microsomal dipeptidase-like Zn-dependent dipeptidase